MILNCIARGVGRFPARPFPTSQKRQPKTRWTTHFSTKNDYIGQCLCAAASPRCSKNALPLPPRLPFTALPLPPYPPLLYAPPCPDTCICPRRGKNMAFIIVLYSHCYKKTLLLLRFELSFYSVLFGRKESEAARKNRHGGRKTLPRRAKNLATAVKKQVRRRKTGAVSKKQVPQR